MPADGAATRHASSPTATSDAAAPPRCPWYDDCCAARHRGGPTSNHPDTSTAASTRHLSVPRAKACLPRQQCQAARTAVTSRMFDVEPAVLAEATQRASASDSHANAGKGSPVRGHWRARRPASQAAACPRDLIAGPNGRWSRAPCRRARHRGAGPATGATAPARRTACGCAPRSCYVFCGV